MKFNFILTAAFLAGLAYSAEQGRVQLKSYFETGDKPTQAEFGHLIDSAYNITDDVIAGFTTFAELDALAADKSLVNLEDAKTWTGVQTFGGFNAGGTTVFTTSPTFNLGFAVASGQTITTDLLAESTLNAGVTVSSDLNVDVINADGEAFISLDDPTLINVGLGENAFTVSGNSSFLGTIDCTTLTPTGITVDNAGILAVDTINESTAAAGVTIDTLTTVKDGTVTTTIVKTDTINEATAAAGLTLDVLTTIKDGDIGTTGDLTLTAGSVELDAGETIAWGTGDGFIEAGTVGDTMVLKTGATTAITIGPAQNLSLSAPLFILEQAAADADVATYGQLWVKTATPNQLFFTDDAGTDHPLGESASNLCDSYISSAAASAAVTQTVYLNVLANATIADAGFTSANFTVDDTNKRWTYTGTETRIFKVTGSFSMTSSQSNEILRFRLAENGTTAADTEIARMLGTGTDLGAAAIQGIFELATDDYIELWATLDASSSDTITVNNLNITIENL